MTPYSTVVMTSMIPVKDINVLDDTYKPTDISKLIGEKPCFPTNRWNLDKTFWTIEQKIIFPQPDYVPPPSKSNMHYPETFRSWHRRPPIGKKFSAIRKDRDIKMTTYSVGTIRSFNFLMKDVRVDEMTPRGSYRGYQKSLSSSNPYYGSWTPTPSTGSSWSVDHTTSWVGRPPKGCASSGYRYYSHSVPWLRSNLKPYQKTTFNFNGTYLPDIPFQNEFQEPQTDRYIQTVIADSTIKLRSDLDVLTNIAELPKSLKTLKDLYEDLGVYTKRIMSEIKKSNPKAKNFKDLSNELQNKWMEYRYGIMPMVYTIQDIEKTIRNQFISFKTGRSVISVDLAKKPPLLINRLAHREAFDVVEGSLTIKATCKAKFTNSLSSALYTIQVNPFVTGWELLPLSFVVDWFINIGDVISHNTSSLALSIFDIAEEKGCYSLRYQYRLSKYVMTEDSIYLDNKLVKSTLTPSLCETRYVNTYERKTFDPKDLVLPQWQSDVYSNWRRIIDSLIISKNTFKSSLRS